MAKIAGSQKLRLFSEYSGHDLSLNVDFDVLNWTNKFQI